MTRALLLLLALSACPAPKDTANPGDTGGDDTGGGDTGETATDADADDDGFIGADDCDDANPDVHPEADEHCDGVDEDCDGAQDEDAVDALTFYTDADGDGDGDPASAYAACSGTDPTTGDDCDDTDPAVFPGATEVCNGVDDDCDASTVEDGAIEVAGVAFTDLQAALDAAAEGDTVAVCGGSYTGAFVIARSLTLSSPVGASSTVVDAAGAGPALTVEAGDVRVEGFTFTGGVGADREGDTFGGGVSALDATSLTLVDCAVTANQADRGGGVAGPLAGSLVIEGGSVTGNTATTAGGGVYAGETTSLTGLEIGTNTSYDGGGLYIPASGIVTVSGGSLVSNTASGKAGGAYLGSGATLTSGTTRWEGNTATSYGGAAYLDAATLSFVGDTLDANASNDKGGHVYANTGSAITAEDTSFVGGTGTWGGGLFLYTSTFTGLRTTFQYNVSDLGGALYVYISSSATLTDSTVEGNYSEAGAGARVRTTSTLTSTNTSWGDDAADNQPDDVDMVGGETYGDFGAAETFTCSNADGTCQ